MQSSFLADINWLHVLVAALAYFALGSVWYSALFGKQWVRYQKIDMNDPEAKKGVAAIMIGSFLLMFVVCAGLEILVSLLGLAGALAGAKLGLLTGVCFSAATISICYVYVKKPLGLHLIDGLYNIIGQIIAGIILAIWT